MDMILSGVGAHIFIISILVAVLFGIAGSFVFAEKLTYSAGAISHSTMGGVGIALMLQINYGLGVDPIWGALVFAIVFALLIAFIWYKDPENLESIIGVSWAVGMSIGILALSLTPSFADPTPYLFGNIMLVSQFDIWLTGAIILILTVILIVYFNKIHLVMIDRDFAKFCGVNIKLYKIFSLVILGLVVALMIKVVGIIFIIAMLSIPPGIVRLHVRTFQGMLISSVIVSVIISILGVICSFYLDVNTGPVIVLVGGVLYLANFLLFAKNTRK